MQGFTDWPTLVHVQPLVLCSSILGALTSSLIIIEVIRLIIDLIFVEHGATQIRELHHLMLLFIFAAVYSMGAFLAFWIQTRMMHPTLVIGIIVIVWVCVTAVLLAQRGKNTLQQVDTKISD